MKCSACGSRDIDFHESGGHSYCVSCGNLVEENTIVNSIEFQENGDRSQVIGQFVAANCSRPYSSSNRSTKGRFGSGRDSREQTIFKVKQIINQITSALSLPDDGIADRALGLYQLAMEKNFVFGRRQVHVASTCLYAICRKESKPHLLIDFSDALQVNVYVLGKSFLQFIRLLNLQLPIIDPGLYIHRFALRLSVGDKMNSVITVALRIVTRLKKDWIVMGRRPDGICAAALLISARAHGFPISQGEIAKIFRISYDTIKRRLEDFRATPSAQLTVFQFYHNDSAVEFDPPAYIRNLLHETAAANVLEDSSLSLTTHSIQLSLEGEEGSSVIGSSNSSNSSSSSSSSSANNNNEERDGEEGNNNYSSSSSSSSSFSSNQKQNLSSSSSTTNNSTTNTTTNITTTNHHLIEQQEELIEFTLAHEKEKQELQAREEKRKLKLLKKQNKNQKSKNNSNNNSSASSSSSSGGNGGNKKLTGKKRKRLLTSRSKGDDGSEIVVDDDDSDDSDYEGGSVQFRIIDDSSKKKRGSKGDDSDDDDDNEEDEDDEDVTSLLGSKNKVNIKNHKTRSIVPSIRTVIGGIAVDVPIPLLKVRHITEKMVERQRETQDFYDEMAIELENDQQQIQLQQQSQSKSKKLIKRSGNNINDEEDEDDEDGGIHFSSSNINNRDDDDDDDGVDDDDSNNDQKQSSEIDNTMTNNNNGVDEGNWDADGIDDQGDGQEDRKFIPHMPGYGFQELTTEETDLYILSEEEQKKRGIIWEQNFRAFMDEQEIKRHLREVDELQRGPSVNKSGRIRKKTIRRDTAKSTPSQAVLTGDEIVVKRTSKKINYDALVGAFDNEGNFIVPTLQQPQHDNNNHHHLNNNNNNNYDMTTAAVMAASSLITPLLTSSSSSSAFVSKGIPSLSSSSSSSSTPRSNINNNTNGSNVSSSTIDLNENQQQTTTATRRLLTKIAVGSSNGSTKTNTANTVVVHRVGDVRATVAPSIVQKITSKTNTVSSSSNSNNIDTCEVNNVVNKDETTTKVPVANEDDGGGDYEDEDDEDDDELIHIGSSNGGAGYDDDYETEEYY